MLNNRPVFATAAQHPHKQVLELLVIREHVVGAKNVQVKRRQKILVEQTVAPEIDGQEVKAFEAVNKLHLFLLGQPLS